MTAVVDFTHAANILRQYNAAYLARHNGETVHDDADQ